MGSRTRGAVDHQVADDPAAEQEPRPADGDDVQFRPTDGVEVVVTEDPPRMHTHFLQNVGDERPSRQTPDGRLLPIHRPGNEAAHQEEPHANRNDCIRQELGNHFEHFVSSFLMMSATKGNPLFAQKAFFLFIFSSRGSISGDAINMGSFRQNNL